MLKNIKVLCAFTLNTEAFAGIIIGVYTNSEAIAEIINHRCLRILLMNALAV